MWTAYYREKHSTFLKTLLSVSKVKSIPMDYFEKRIKSQGALAFYENGQMVFFVDEYFNYAAINEDKLKEGLRLAFLSKFFYKFWENSGSRKISGISNDEIQMLVEIIETFDFIVDFKFEIYENEYVLMYSKNEILDIKDKIDEIIFCNGSEFEEYEYVIKYLLNDTIPYDLELVEANKDYIINQIYKRSIERLKMFDRHIPVKFQQEIFFSEEAANAGAMEKFKEKLLGFGYTSMDHGCNEEETALENSYERQNKRFFIDDNRLVWYFSRCYDDKFNDESLAYFRHVFKRHIRKDLGKHSTSATAYDRLGNHISVSKFSYNVIPYITENGFNQVIKNRKLLDVCIKELGWSQSMVQVLTIMLLESIKLLRKHLSDNQIVELVCNQFSKANESQVHDILYKWEVILKKHARYTTKKALITLLLKSNDSLEFHTQQLARISSIPGVDEKALRKSVSKAIKNGENIKDIIDPIAENYTKLFLARKKIKDVVKYNNFLERMNVYNGEISLVDLFKVFKGRTHDVVNGSIEGIFEPEDIYPDLSAVSSTVKEIFKTRNKNTQKLFTKLNKVHPVSDILNGDIPFGLVPEVIEVLKKFGFELKFSNLALFHGKIEPKCSPEYLIAGDASKCCMNFGEVKAIDYALQKGFGIFNVYFKGLVIANSVLWINEELDMLVIDNIELNGNYSRFTGPIKDLYGVMIETLVKKYKLNGAIQGGMHNDIKLFDDSNQLLNVPITMKDVYKKDVYTDAHFGYIIGQHSESIKSKIEKYNRDGRKYRFIEYDAEDYALAV